MVPVSSSTSPLFPVNSRSLILGTYLDLPRRRCCDSDDDPENGVLFWSIMVGVPSKDFLNCCTRLSVLLCSLLLEFMIFLCIDSIDSEISPVLLRPGLLTLLLLLLFSPSYVCISICCCCCFSFSIKRCCTYSIRR